MDGWPDWMTGYLFVYGTLLRGEERDGMVLSLPMTPATARGRLHLAPAGYPALQLDPNGPEVRGELLTLEQPGLLTLLDLVEGVSDGLYTRSQITVQTEDGLFEAWAYVIDRHQLRRARCRPLTVHDWRDLSRRG